jgi:hypothetical protein
MINQNHREGGGDGGNRAVKGVTVEKEREKMKEAIDLKVSAIF